MIKVKDSKGKPSTTLGLVSIAFVSITIAFLYATFKLNQVDLMAYGTGVMTILAPFVAREFKEKDIAKYTE